MADNFNFHETFQPELAYIARILELAADECNGDKFQISNITGIPTGKEKGKVEPHIKYATFMGLINYEVNRGVYSLSLTSLGSEVWEQDKYLHEELSLWLLHYCITRREIGAPQWSYLVHKINDGFNTETSTNYISSLIQKNFAVNSSDASKGISVVKNCYESGALSRLQYLEWEDKLRFREQTEDLQYQYLYAYALLDAWDHTFPNKKEITLLEVIDTIGYGKVFGFNEEELDSVLSTMADNGMVSINRQLFPVTIIRTTSAEDVIRKLYSSLM